MRLALRLYLEANGRVFRLLILPSTANHGRACETYHLPGRSLVEQCGTPPPNTNRGAARRGRWAALHASSFTISCPNRGKWYVYTIVQNTPCSANRPY